MHHQGPAGAIYDKDDRWASGQVLQQATLSIISARFIVYSSALDLCVFSFGWRPETPWEAAAVSSLRLCVWQGYFFFYFL